MERRNRQFGYILTNQGNFRMSCFNHNSVQQQGGETILDINFCMERITDRDLDVEIEHFLSTFNEKI